MNLNFNDFQKQNIVFDIKELQKAYKEILAIKDFSGPDGISNFINYISSLAVKFQNGFIYHYAFVMLLGFSALLTFLILK